MAIAVGGQPINRNSMANRFVKSHLMMSAFLASRLLSEIMILVSALIGVEREMMFIPVCRRSADLE
jgi:hypothetical protein